MASPTLPNPDTDQVLVEHNQFVKTLTLNRPRRLNALSYAMVSRLWEVFRACEEDPGVKMIMLKGRGRAFCAGGDVAAVVQNINNGNWRLAAEYYRREYALNYLMATYAKPQVSILDGIIMGGGVGISIYGRFRVVTENTVFSMPETALGIFPDVGASYFLSRLPGFFGTCSDGEYVGLTGARLDGAEMLACGLATHYVESKKLPLLEAGLYKESVNDPINISGVIDKYAKKPEVKEDNTYNRLDIIDRCFSHKTVEEIISALENEMLKRNHEWIQTALRLLKRASPLSLKITLKSIREGRLQTLDQCLVREYRMVCHVVRANISKDFIEGCRALFIDKDKNPQWRPWSLNQVSDSMVELYFSKLEEDEGGCEDLKLPVTPTIWPTKL